MDPDPLRDAAVVVLAYGHDHFRGVLEGLRREHVAAAQVIVVQNPREPGEAEVDPRWEGVTVVRMPTNVGYAAAMNAGLRLAVARGAVRSVLLTHDVEIAPGALAQLVRAAAELPRAGVTGPRLRWRQPDQREDYATFGGWWDDRGWISHHRDRQAPHDHDHPGLTGCDYVDGSVFVLEHAALAAAGPFDECFFLYFEETELCLRVARAGFRVACAADVEFAQESGIASRPGVAMYLIARNQLEFSRRLGGTPVILRTARRRLRGLPYRRLAGGERRVAVLESIGTVLGLLAFALGRLGPPPAWLPGSGDVSVGRRRSRVPTGIVGLLVLVVAIGLAACGAGGSAAARRPPRLLATHPDEVRPCRPQPATVGAADRLRQDGRGLVLGVSAGLRYGRGPNQCHLANLVQSIGASMVREDFDWNRLQPGGGRFDWSSTDEFVTVAARRGLTVLPILGDEPRWTRGRLTRAYAAFVAAVVHRYGPSGTFWTRPGAPTGARITWFELWNEPFIPNNPIALTAHRYARLVAAAVPAGRAADPAARFLIAGEAQYTALDGRFRDNWTADVLDARPGLAADVDGVSVHPYGPKPAPYDPQSGDREQVGRLEAVHAALVAHGLGARPLWVTEIGWSTCADRTQCVSEGTQASDLKAFLHLARTRWRAYVRAVFVYQLAENPYDRRPDDRERFFGLLRGDGRAKPALGVFSAAARAP